MPAPADNLASRPAQPAYGTEFAATVEDCARTAEQPGLGAAFTTNGTVAEHLGEARRDGGVAARQV